MQLLVGNAKSQTLYPPRAVNIPPQRRKPSDIRKSLVTFATAICHSAYQLIKSGKESSVVIPHQPIKIRTRQTAHHENRRV